MSTSHRFTRRDVLLLAAGGVVTASIVAAGGWRITQRPILSPDTPSSSGLGGSGVPRNPLRIPQLAEATFAADGTREFTLTAQAGVSEFLPNTKTPTWGYNGAFGGPTLRAAQGERVRIRVQNDLPEVTTTHWHGMKVPALADGGPHQPIHPGMDWTAEWEVEQPAATLWYHPHNHGTTEAHVYRGLAGMFIIDDAPGATTNAAALPHEYGIDDVPLVLSDRSFATDGSFDETRRDASGMLGDTVLVNGTVRPSFEAARSHTRLRVLNGSTARTYRLRLDQGPLTIVGTDSGLLPTPVVVDGVTLTPGERVELVVALNAGETAMLHSVPHSLGLLANTERASGARDRFDLLEITRPATSGADGETVPPVAEWIAGLGAIAPAFPAPRDPDRRRTITLQDNKINHRRMNMARIDEVVELGAHERWLITNEHFLPHNLHIHNARFRVFTVDGQPPGPEHSGWKDTVYAPPSRTVVVDVEYGGSTDPHRPYMFHCHLLQHEDQGMMAQFVVVKPGEAAGPLKTPITEAGGAHSEH